MTETAMTICGLKTMKMSRVMMAKAGPPHNKGITFEKFAEHRGYAMPGYEPKHPKEGEVAPDGPIWGVDDISKKSTLLTEAKKWPRRRSKKVIVCFDAITCPSSAPTRLKTCSRWRMACPSFTCISAKLSRATCLTREACTASRR